VTSRTTLRRLILPAVMTLAMLGVLVSLGNWQLRRLAWKQELLAQIAQAEASPAVPLPANPEPYQKVRAEGTIRADRTALYGAFVRESPQGPRMGAELLAVMERKDGPPLLVDLGWVPQGALPSAEIWAGKRSVEGFIRAAERPGWFSAKDNPADRHFYTLDPAAIGAALGERLAPFTLIALGPTPPGGAPDPAHALPRPRNAHLSYAITWYGLAAALIVIFALWAQRTLRE